MKVPVFSTTHLNVLSSIPADHQNGFFNASLIRSGIDKRILVQSGRGNVFTKLHQMKYGPSTN